MGTLKEILGKDQRTLVVDATVRLIDEEMSRKRGLRVMPLKAGYKLVKGVRPNFVRACVDFLLDEFSDALDPFYQDWKKDPTKGPIADALRSQQDRVADSLLGVTDKRAERSKHTILKKTYFKLRGRAKNHVIDALPGLGRAIQPYLK